MSPSTIHITFTLPPSSLTEFHAVLKTLRESVIQEPECLYLNCFEVPKQAGVVRVVEIWSKDKRRRKEVKPFLKALSILNHS
jgi:quinol monooxygenase YgiN